MKTSFKRRGETIIKPPIILNIRMGVEDPVSGIPDELALLVAVPEEVAEPLVRINDTESVPELKVKLWSPVVKGVSGVQFHSSLLPTMAVKELVESTVILTVAPVVPAPSNEGCRLVYQTCEGNPPETS